MERILTLDRKLSSLLKNFPRVARELEFEPVCILGKKDGLDAVDCPGIYMIEIRAGRAHKTIEGWLAAFTLQWDQEAFRQSFVPTSKKGRMKQHTELSEWMPLYIGKSKRIKQRIQEHIDLPLAARTFALKLRERGLFEARKFRLKVLRLQVQNYDVIAPKLESELRKKFNPIVGKQ